VVNFAGDAMLTRGRLGSTPRFEIEIDGSVVATFSECSGLGVTVQTEKMEEGGANHTTHKFPGRVDYSNLVLKHGITYTTDLFDWFMQVVRGEKVRKQVSIRLFGYEAGGDGLKEMTSWQYLDAFPVKWTGPTLQATSNNVAVETLELAHEGFVTV
jgi:phage tail-like protein